MQRTPLFLLVTIAPLFLLAFEASAEASAWCGFTFTAETTFYCDPNGVSGCVYSGEPGQSGTMDVFIGRKRIVFIGENEECLSIGTKWHYPLGGEWSVKGDQFG